MPDCTSCSLFQPELGCDESLRTNRPGGLELTRQAIDMCTLPSGSSVLDVANGTSCSLQYLAMEKGFKAIGLDASFSILRQGQKIRPGLNVIQARCEQIPLISGSHHCILMECAFSLSGRSDVTLSEFNRILNAGGKLIVSDIYIRELADPRGTECLSTTNCLSGITTEQSIRKQLTKFGFKITTWQDHTLLLKKWLSQMVFKLGSLDAVYRRLTRTEKDAKALNSGLGNRIKLGYYLMIAQKVN